MVERVKGQTATATKMLTNRQPSKMTHRQRDKKDTQTHRQTGTHRPMTICYQILVPVFFFEFFLTVNFCACPKMMKDEEFYLA